MEKISSSPSSPEQEPASHIEIIFAAAKESFLKFPQNHFLSSVAVTNKILKHPEMDLGTVNDLIADESLVEHLVSHANRAHAAYDIRSAGTLGITKKEKVSKESIRRVLGGLDQTLKHLWSMWSVEKNPEAALHVSEIVLECYDLPEIEDELHSYREAHRGRSEISSPNTPKRIGILIKINQIAKDKILKQFGEHSEEYRLIQNQNADDQT